MEGSESGALVPSDTTMEVETWVKLSSFPAEFLTAEAISFIVSSFGSPVAADEDTYEKVENHKRPPKLRRKLHSRKTFVTILVRVSVTKPLPSRVTVGCPQGREYIIRLDFDPTPKVCLLCLGAGHFDLECCGTEEATEEIMEDDAEAGEDFLGVDLQLADWFDSMSDEVDGEQGAVTTDGVESFEDSTVVEAVNLPAATCDIGDALVGELEAVHTILDGFFEHSLVERTAAVLEVQPLLPATIAADGSEGTVISDGFVCSEDPPVVEAVLEVSPHSLPPASCEFGDAKVGDLEAVQTFSDIFDDEPLVGKEIAADPLASVGESIVADLQKLAVVAISDGFDEEPTVERMAIVSCLVDEQGAVITDWVVWYDNPTDVEAALVEDFHIIEQVFFVVKSSDKHHKWREKSDVQGLVCCSNVLGLSGFDEHSSVETSAVLSFSDFGAAYFGAAYFGTSPAAFLQGRADSCFDQDIFELEVLQSLGRFMAATNSTQDQLIFKIQHKWREKSLDWSADRIWVFLM